MRFGRSLRFGFVSICSVLGASTMSAELVQADEAVGWREQEAWVWRYDFGTQSERPSLSVLRIPGGEPLLAPPGIQFRWSMINGVAPTAVGRVTWRKPIVEALPDGGAVIRQRIDYLDSNGRPEIAEYRDLVFSEVGRNGRYSVDWTSHFTAGEAGTRLEDGDEELSGLTFVLHGGRDPVEFVVMSPATDADTAEPQTQGVATLLYPESRHPGSIAVLADARSTVGPQRWRLSGEAPKREITAALLRDGPRTWLPATSGR